MNYSSFPIFLTIVKSFKNAAWCTLDMLSTNPSFNHQIKFITSNLLKHF